MTLPAFLFFLLLTGLALFGIGIAVMDGVISWVQGVGCVALIGVMWWKAA